MLAFVSNLTFGADRHHNIRGLYSSLCGIHKEVF